MTNINILLCMYIYYYWSIKLNSFCCVKLHLNGCDTHVHARTTEWKIKPAKSWYVDDTSVHFPELEICTWKARKKTNKKSMAKKKVVCHTHERNAWHLRASMSLVSILDKLFNNKPYTHLVSKVILKWCFVYAVRIYVYILKYECSLATISGGNLENCR